MDVRILDLDGSLTGQRGLFGHRLPRVFAAPGWGPRLRLACGFARFRRFEQELVRILGAAADTAPGITLYGSGDFHHVSLALVRRQARPFNLLVLDNHPDWMRGIPFLHCGTWLRHAARLPLVQNVFHVGGDVDFDNGFRWLAPWPELCSGRVAVLPARRQFRGRRWADVSHEPLRPAPREPLTARRMDGLLDPFRFQLARWPLYVSLDKDVMTPADAAVNWDSGHLGLAEVQTVLGAFVRAARGRLAGADVVGDWSPVRLAGWFRRLLHWTEHPPLAVVPAEAQRLNERTNQALLDTLLSLAARQRVSRSGPWSYLPGRRGAA